MNPLRLILVLCVLGLVVSGYLTYLHFRPEKLDTSFCNISDYLSCSTVNKSSYAWFLGVPVSFIGMFGFLLMGGLALSRFQYNRVGIFFLSLFGLGFMVYLTAAEVFIIGAVCVLCVVVALIVFDIFFLSWKHFGKESVEFVREIRVE